MGRLDVMILPKPFDMDALLATVAKAVLNLSARTATNSPAPT